MKKQIISTINGDQSLIHKSSIEKNYDFNTVEMLLGGKIKFFKKNDKNKHKFVSDSQLDNINEEY